MVCQKRGYTQRLKNTNSQRRNQHVRRKIQEKNGNTSKPTAEPAAEASKTVIERKLKRKHFTERTKEIKYSNSKMVSRWG